MRELKFRAWDKEEKRMWNWEEVLQNWDLIYSVLTLIRQPSEIFKGATASNQAYSKAWELELMQYTGLKDENGKEIYEGDIVKNSDNWGLTKGIIEWDDEYFGYPLLSEEVATGNKLIVIGNIYEGEG